MLRYPSPSLLARLAVLLSAALIVGCGDDSSGVEVTEEVKITVTPSDLVLTIGSSAQLEATVHDPEGRPVTGPVVQWSSSAPEIVSVSTTGMVTARSVGQASITALSDYSVGSARVVVQLNFRIPVSSLNRWLVITETGTPTTECPENEGGLRMDGGRDCTHSGVSRYSLDLADADQWAGASSDGAAPGVVAAAQGVITDVCLHPAPQVTCDPHGPFILVEHPGGFTTFYAHLDPSSVTLRRKTPVWAGQPLGTMGIGRGYRAPWLHFELRHNNRGAGAGSVLEALEIEGRRMQDYKAGDAR